MAETELCPCWKTGIPCDACFEKYMPRLELKLQQRRLETADLEKALDPLEPAPGSALAKIQSLFNELMVLAKDVNLETVPDEELLKEDAITRTRLTYVLAMGRLYKLLRMEFPKTVVWNKEIKEYEILDIQNDKAIVEQAKIALGFVRHAETLRLEALQVGKTKSDAKLIETVAKLRGEVEEIARQRKQWAAPEAPKQWEKTDAVSKTEV